MGNLRADPLLFEQGVLSLAHTTHVCTTCLYMYISPKIRSIGGKIYTPLPLASPFNRLTRPSQVTKRRSIMDILEIEYLKVGWLSPSTDDSVQLLLSYPNFCGGISQFSW
jgi:hypothetical protein